MALRGFYYFTGSKNDPVVNTLRLVPDLILSKHTQYDLIIYNVSTTIYVSFLLGLLLVVVLVTSDWLFLLSNIFQTKLPLMCCRFSLCRFSVSFILVCCRCFRFNVLRAILLTNYK